MKTIFLIVPLRISVRYALSGGLLDELRKQKNLKVIIFSIIDDINFTSEFASSNTTIEIIPRVDEANANLAERFIRTLREYFFGAYQDTETFKLYVKRHGELAYFFHRIAVFFLKRLKFIGSFLAWLDFNFIAPGRDGNYEKFFDKYRPDLVVAYSAFDQSGLPLVRLAKRKNIPTMGVVLSWDHLVTPKGAAASVSHDKLIVWNELMRQEAVQYFGYDEKDVIITGTPQFDYYIKFADEIETRESFFKKYGLDPKKKLIFYTTSPPRISPNEPEILKMLYNIVTGNKLNTKVQIFVRIYGRDDPKRYNELYNKPGLVFDYALNSPEGLNYTQTDKYFMIHFASSLKNADLVMNVVSTTTIDAAIFDKPVVNINFMITTEWHKMSHFINLLKTNGSRVVKNEQELIYAINGYLKNPKLDETGRKRIIKELCWKIDGQAGKRIADYTVKFLEARK